jgi:hypothetical protein
MAVSKSPSRNCKRRKKFTKRKVEGRMLEKIWPKSFTHWEIQSTKRNAVLCKVARGNKELGLFWKFQSPDAEFDYSPAVYPRDDKGQIKMSSDDCLPAFDSVRYGAFLLGKDLNETEGPRDPKSPILYFEGHYNDYEFDRNFKEGDVKTYAELLKQVDRGTKDYDDTIFVQKFEPHPLARLIPIFALAFWLIIIWSLYLAFWKR